MNKGYSGLPTFEFGGTLRYRGNSPTEFLLREEGIGHTWLQTTSTQKGQIGTIAKLPPFSTLRIAKPSPKSDRFQEELKILWLGKRRNLGCSRFGARIISIDLTEQTREIGVALSAHPEGERKLWGNIWKCQVPQKIRIFAWKVSKDILPTKLNKFGRHLEANPVCDILCGSGRESSYHATVLCPQARALRDAMRHRQHWELLDELQFRYTCKEWLLLLLDKCSMGQRPLILLGGHGMCIIASLIMQETSPWRIPSVGFLLSYWESFTRCSEPPLGLNTKGKQTTSYLRATIKISKRATKLHPARHGDRSTRLDQN